MTTMKLTNPMDLWADERTLASEGNRAVRVDGLVDTRATLLVLPRDVCECLGLRFFGTRRVRYANGATGEVPWTAVHLEILGRQMFCDALVEAAGTTPLIGQIPLEELDLIVDPKSRELLVNPASPDAPLLDLLAVA